ncbi:uroporphyrinogen-III synthase [Candidatus Bathyarchaeota archaeon]|nr:MAG: uroporphyrinogen-III synthase [Candidatus Bathyarchaeota archaeon]
MSRVSGEKSIAITRPVGHGEETSRFVRKLGWTPFIVHAVELRPLEQSSILKEFSRIVGEGPVDWLVFMSPTGVDVFFDMLKSHSSVLPSALGQIRIMAVGPKTSGALRRQGVQDVVVPEKYSSSGIADHLSRLETKGQRVVLVRSSAADDRLSGSLASNGAAVETITIYQSLIPTNSESVFDFLARLEKGQFQAVLFTSAASASNLFSMAEYEIPKSLLVKLMRLPLVGAIGPATAEKLQELGIVPNVPGRYLIEDAIGQLVKKAEEQWIGKH